MTVLSGEYSHPFSRRTMLASRLQKVIFDFDSLHNINHAFAFNLHLMKKSCAIAQAPVRPRYGR